MIFDVTWLHALLPPIAGVADTLMSWLEASGGLAGYGIMLLAFLVGSVGFPLPEEAVLAMGGFLAASGEMSLLGVYFFGYSVVLSIDLALYEVGLRAGPAVEHSRLGRKISAARWASARDFFERRGVLTVVIARFVMGIRIPVFLLSGALGLSRRVYYSTVAISGLFSNAIPVALGYLLADDIDRVLRGIDRAYGWFAGLIVVGLLVALIYLRRRRKRLAAAQAGGGGTPGADA